MGTLERWETARARQRELLADLVLDAPAVVDVVLSSLQLEMAKLPRGGSSLVSFLDTTRDLLTQFTPLRHGLVVVEGSAGAVGAGFGDLAGADAREALDMVRSGTWSWRGVERPWELHPLGADGVVSGALVCATPKLLGRTELGGAVAALLSAAVADVRRLDDEARATALAELGVAVAQVGDGCTPDALQGLAELAAMVPGVLGAGVRVLVDGVAPHEVWAGRRASVAEVVRAESAAGEGAGAAVELWLTVTAPTWPAQELRAVTDRLADAVAVSLAGERARRWAERDEVTGFPGRLGAERAVGAACGRAERDDDAFTVVGVAVDDGPRLRRQGLVARADALLRNAAAGVAAAFPQGTVVRIGDDAVALIADGVEGPGAEAVAAGVHAAATRAMAGAGVSARQPSCRVAVVGWSTERDLLSPGDLLAELTTSLPDVAHPA